MQSQVPNLLTKEDGIKFCADLVKWTRLLYGESRDDFAKRIPGVSADMIYDYVNGRSSPNGPTILKVLYLFSRKIMELLEFGQADSMEELFNSLKDDL